MVSSIDLLDDEVSLILTATLTMNGADQTDTFDAALICTVSGCDPTGRVPATLDAVDCDGNGPTYLNNYIGNSFSNPIVDDYYVRYTNYILTKVELWKN